jgi:hypothetical protein
VDGLGVIGLAVGLWISLATPTRRDALQRALPVALGWLLVAMCGVLLLAGTLSPPATMQGPVSQSGAAGSADLSGQTGALGPAMPAWAYTRPGNDGACAQGGSTSTTAGGRAAGTQCGQVGSYTAP